MELLIEWNKLNNELGNNAKSFIKKVEWQNIIIEWSKLFDDVINVEALVQ